MSIVQWLLLILVILVVAGVYWYMRRQGGGDPWQGMEEPEEPGDEPSSTSNDSYVVGVRTISRETPADRKAAAEQAARAREGDETPASEADRTRAPRQPTAVRRRPAADPQNTEVRSSEIEAPRGLDNEADEPIAAEPAPAEPVEPAAAVGEPPPAEPERVHMVAPHPTEDSQIFVLYVAAPEGQTFDGPAVHDALAKADLKFGLNDMFHRITEVHGVTESVFCVANMLNPGTLDPAEQARLSTPGLALFLLVPGALEGRPAMRDMMETANLLATALGGNVLDDNRALLKAQTAQYMLDQIADIDRRAQLAQRR
ncbi:cell division protein ZipA [Salinisphaera sp. SPP-AMP-43]|uniref:cell division protein ZipA n=1 Tax=Salinisphaera sp. SPP-AMP-43 TaxID=3121288 RepID=UPI003C6E5474